MIFLNRHEQPIRCGTFSALLRLNESGIYKLIL